MRRRIFLNVLLSEIQVKHKQNRKRAKEKWNYFRDLLINSIIFLGIPLLVLLLWGPLFGVCVCSLMAGYCCMPPTIHSIHATSAQHSGKQAGCVVVVSVGTEWADGVLCLIVFSPTSSPDITDIVMDLVRVMVSWHDAAAAAAACVGGRRRRMCQEVNVLGVSSSSLWAGMS